MTPFLRKLLGQNWLLLLIMLALAVFGVVAIYSATSTRSDAYAADFWRKQANWVGVGVFAFMVTSLVHYRWIRWGAPADMLAGIVFLIMTKFMGSKFMERAAGCIWDQSIFSLRSFAVVAGIMVLALFLTQFRQMHPALRLLLSGAIAGAPCLLILMQPDLGEVIIWVPVMFALWFVAGLPLRYTWFASFSSQSRSSRLPLISALNHTSNSGSLLLPILTSISRVRRGRSINR